MIRILGLDPATCMGWAFLIVNDSGEIILEDFGEIVAQRKLNLPQKLNFYYLETKRLVEKIRPDYCAIEDLILGQSGVKVMVYLGRISGVVIHSCFEILKDRVELFYPNVWKANSLSGLEGNAPKWRIQYEVCNYFTDNLDCDVSQWKKILNDSDLEIQKSQNEERELKKQIDLLDKKNKKKRNPLSNEEIEQNQKVINTYKKQYKTKKDYTKSLKKEREKKMNQVSSDIYAQTGISCDIADAICIALCLKNTYGF